MQNALAVAFVTISKECTSRVAKLLRMDVALDVVVAVQLVRSTLLQDATATRTSTVLNLYVGDIATTTS